jgi:helicase
MDQLLRSLEVGLPSDALDLLRVPVSLGRGDYLALYRSGLRTADQVRDMSAENLVTLVGPRLTKLLKPTSG